MKKARTEVPTVEEQIARQLEDLDTKLGKLRTELVGLRTDVRGLRNDQNRLAYAADDIDSRLSSLERVRHVVDHKPEHVMCKCEPEEIEPLSLVECVSFAMLMSMDDKARPAIEAVAGWLVEKAGVYDPDPIMIIAAKYIRDELERDR